MSDRAYRGFTSLQRAWGGLARLDAWVEHLPKDGRVIVLDDPTGDVLAPLAAAGRSVAAPSVGQASEAALRVARAGSALGDASTADGLADAVVLAAPWSPDAEGAKALGDWRSRLAPGGRAYAWVEAAPGAARWEDWPARFAAAGWRPVDVFDLGPAPLPEAVWSRVPRDRRRSVEDAAHRWMPARRWLFALAPCDPSRPLAVHVLPTLASGGAERAAIDLLARLPAQGFSVEAAAILGGGPLEAAYRAAGIPLAVLGLRAAGARGRIRALRRYFSLRRPDVVHAHLYAGDVWGLAAAVLARVPVRVRTEHSVARFYTPWREAVKRIAIRSARAHIAVSEAAKEFLLRQEGVAAGRIHLIRPGIDPGRFPMRPPRPIGSPARLVAVGNLFPAKGHAVLIDALAQLRRPWTLDVVGDGPLRHVLEAQAERLGIASKIRFLGARDDVPEILAAADVACIPSHWEGLGLVVVEAAAVALPLVVSDISSFREILGDAHPAYAAPGNVEAWASRIEGVLAHPDVYLRQAALAAPGIRERFDAERAAVSHAALYRRILASC
jgi:glycosyltransferase involved in cell wall biosynthesis